MSKLKTPLSFWNGAIYDSDNDKICEMAASGFPISEDADHALQILNAINNRTSPTPSIPAALLAAWVMRAWHFGADVEPKLLEWARVNEDGSTQLNHLTLEAVKGGGR